MWDHTLDPLVIVAEAVPARRIEPDSFDLYAQAVPSTIVVAAQRREELLLGTGHRSVRLSIAAGTVLRGPVHLSYRLEGMTAFEQRLLALRRFAGLCRHGRFLPSLFAPDPRSARWTMLVQTLDALANGANTREVAIALFGTARVASDWGGPSDFLRSRVRRLIAQARWLAAQDHRAILLRYR